MRHNNSGRKLGRTSSHRKSLFRNMAKALLTYGRITTTEAKAKELRGVVEPLITLGLKDDLHARREAYRRLGSHQLVKRLFDDVAPAFSGVAGGYTRVLKLDRTRRGDAAPLAVIELTHGAPPAGEAVKSPSAPKARGGKEAKGAAPKGSRAPKVPRAPRTAVPRAPQAVPNASAPKKMKIGGE